MNILIFISIAIALYATYLAQNTHSQINNPPRSFHFTLSQKTGEIDNSKTIKFYVLYLFGSKVTFFDEHTFENININYKIDTFTKISDKKLICFSWGNAIRFGYVNSSNSKKAEIGEELLLDILSLPQSIKNKSRVVKYLKESGWRQEQSLSLKHDLHFTKDKLDIYISYIS